jgi:hypothetical protein
VRPTPAIWPGRYRPSLILLAAGCLLTSCEGPPTGNGSVARVEIWVPWTTFRPGDQVQAYATPLDADGQVVETEALQWRSLTPATVEVNLFGLVTGLAPGTGVIRASVGGVSSQRTLTLENPPIAAISLGTDTLRLALPGGVATLTAAPRDAQGFPIFGETLTWSTSAERIATVNSDGEVRAIAVGVSVVTVEAQGVERNVVVLVDAPPTATSPTITSVSPAVALPGLTMVVTGTGFSGNVSTNSVLIDGIAIAVTSASASQLVLSVPAAAEFPCEPSRTVALQVTSPGGIGTSTVTLQVATPRDLAVGQSLTFTTAAEARCNELAPATGKYVITIPNGGRALGASAMGIDVRGTATSLAGLGGGMLASASDRNAMTTRAHAQRIARRRAVGSRPGGRAAARSATRNTTHLRLLEENRAVASPRPVTGSPGSLAQLGTGSLTALAGLEAGGVIPLRFPSIGSPNLCSNYTALGARVVYAGPHVTILEDTLPELGGVPTLAGQLDDLYAEFGAELEAVAWGVIETFGDPLVMDSRLDADGRVRILMTPRMNQAAGGSALAAVVTCDFYARAQLPSSNMGEYLYLQVPTTLDEGSGAGTRARWRHEMRATVVHELKHITSYAERIVRNHPLEESWLEEATARQAEELFTRTVFGTVRNGDHEAEATLVCELLAGDPSAPQCAATPRAMRPHVEGLWAFLEAPDLHTPLGSAWDPFDFSYYGSGWALTRWLLDVDALSEPATFTALTTSSQSGVTNLQNRTGRDWDEILPQWSLAMLTDGRLLTPPASARLTFPSWNLGSLFRAMCDYAGNCGAYGIESPYSRAHPWQPLALEAGDFLAAWPTVVPGGFAAFELTSPAGVRQLIEVRGLNGAPVPGVVRMGILRVQ